MAPKVVVATLTWNQKSDVLECLGSLVKLDYPNYEIVVVDNGSTDGTHEAIRQQFPEVNIVRHTENLGCAEGVNGEIRYALHVGADYLFIITNDGVVEPSTLKELVQVAERNPKIGIVSPKVYHYGTHRIWFAKGAHIDWLRGKFYGVVRNIEDDGSVDREEETVFFPGGFSLVRAEAIKKVGFLDPDYFIYYDDSDWSYRIHLAGYSGRYTPRARAWHKPSSALGMESPAIYYYRTRNRLFFVKKFSPRTFPIFFSYFLFEFFFQTIPHLLGPRQFPQMRAAFLGLFDFLLSRKGSRNFNQKKKGILVRLFERVKERIVRFKRNLRYTAKKNLGQRLSIRVRLDWNVGDEIMAIPVYEALKNKYPNSMIEAEVKYPELLKGNPFVNWVNQEEKFKPDLIFDLHRKNVTKPRKEFISEILKIDSLSEPKVYLEKEEIESARQKWQLGDGLLRIAISPSVRWFSRMWPKENWVALAEYFNKRHSAQVFVLGKDEETFPLGVNMTGKTGLRETAALLSRCELFVGSDSGLFHLALAVGTPTVGLFGPVNPAHRVSDRPDCIPIWTEVECKGCRSDGRMIHPDHCPKVLPDCMTSISVDRVIHACEELLGAKKSL